MLLKKSQKGFVQVPSEIDVHELQEIGKLDMIFFSFRLI